MLCYNIYSCMSVNSHHEHNPVSGEPIGLKRLLLRPIVRLCIAAKEREEQREKHQRDRD